MSRYVRNTAIRALLETPYGSNPGVGTDTDAILIANATFKIDRDVVPRNLIRGFFGGSEHLIGTRRAEIEFDVELAGSGAAGTAPAWGRLLRACGMAQVITAGSRVEYNPVTTAQESISLHYFLDGIRYVSRGCRGNVMFMMNGYERPMLRFRFMGFDTFAAEQPASTFTSNFTAWQRPLVITDQNSGQIVMGGTLAVAGTITGGTVLPSRGMEIDLGNTLSHVKLLGGEAIDITNRETTGKATVFLTAAQEVTWRDEVNANALTTFGFSHGTVAGNSITVWAPSVQRIAPQPIEYEGRAMVETELRLLPTGAGNNELRIVVR